MAAELGMVLNGEVTKITNFGAFIKLENNELGLCHVSELSNTFVKNVSDVLEVGQEVKVKVIKVEGNGKISLSIKQTQAKPRERKKSSYDKPGNSYDKPRDSYDKPRNSYDKPREAYKSKPSGDFEGMLSSFIKTSDEKQSGTKKKAKGSRRGNGFNSKR